MSVRNIWITEKQQQIDFMDGDQHHTAKWSDIVDLFNVEKKDMFRPSRLKEVSVFPKPIERQRVATCLNIFSDDTIADLKSNETVHNNEGTIHFFEMIVRFGTWLQLKAPIEDASDQRLIFLLNLAHIADNMAEQTGKRHKCLTKDTAKALSATCRGFVEIAKQLLTNTHEYVLFGLFTTDPLEKMFGKLRRGVGGTYFINVRQVLEKLAIHQTTIMLKSDQIFFEMEAKLGHQCDLCSFNMNDDSLTIFEELEILEDSIPNSVKETLVYIAGYVAFKTDAKSNEDTFISTMRGLENYK